MIRRKTFKQPPNTLIAKYVLHRWYRMKTAMFLHFIDKDIECYDRYIKSCIDERERLNKERAKCVKWRLKDVK